MKNFVAGLALILGVSTAFAIIYPILKMVVIGTSFSENIMTYLVPLGIFAVLIVGTINKWFVRRPRA